MQQTYQLTRLYHEWRRNSNANTTQTAVQYIYTRSLYLKKLHSCNHQYFEQTELNAILFPNYILKVTASKSSYSNPCLDILSIWFFFGASIHHTIICRFLQMFCTTAVTCENIFSCYVTNCKIKQRWHVVINCNWNQEQKSCKCQNSLKAVFSEVTQDYIGAIL